MKALPFILVLSGLLSCQKDEPIPFQNFDLVYQQPATVAGIQATLVKVYDSRCPTGAQCIWAGFAAVTVTLAEGGDTQTAGISLHFKADAAYQPDSALLTLNHRAYWLRLLAVNPYPSTTPSSQPPTATLRLRPQ